MEKRYQVFVSSTYIDLQEERQQVLQALMKMDCIPAGMELFPAADEEQMEFIKRVIDDCDYYLLIIGGKYGSLSQEGISYTEMEYEYAVEQGIKIVALLHKDPDNLPGKKIEIASEAREKLNQFREKVANGRIVDFWTRSDQLAGLVALSLLKTIKMYPAIGWVRANTASNPDLLDQINELRKKNESLEIETKRLKSSIPQDIPDLASGDEIFKVHGTNSWQYDNSTRNWEKDLSWNQIFGYIGPHILENLNDATVKIRLTNSVFELTKIDGYSPDLNDEVFQTIKIQMIALGLVKVQSMNTINRGMALFWIITEKGMASVVAIRSVKTRPT